VKKDFFILVESGEQLSEIARLWQTGKMKTSVGLVVDGLTEEGVRDGWTLNMFSHKMRTFQIISRCLNVS
jgi:hypothetical protein